MNHRRKLKTGDDRGTARVSQCADERGKYTELLKPEKVETKHPAEKQVRDRKKRKGKPARKEKQDEIGRVEDTHLRVAEQRLSEQDVRVPERYLPLQKTLSLEVRHREKVKQDVAPVKRLAEQ